jgi:phenylalanyl-tRNA synthetase beta chain
MIFDETVRWSQLAETILSAGGPLLRDLRYRETYRDAAKDGEGKKRILFSFAFQSDSRTLTSQEADDSRQQIIAACESKLGGKLIATS